MKEANLLRGKLCLFSKEKSFNDFARNCKSLEKIINEIKNRSHYKLQRELLGRKDVLKLLVLQKKKIILANMVSFSFIHLWVAKQVLITVLLKKVLGKQFFSGMKCFFSQ